MAEVIRQLPATFHRIFIAPRSTDPDSRRHEFILNVLLSGLSLVAICSVFSMLTHLVLSPRILYASSLITLPSFTLFVMALLWLSRKGYFRFIALFLLFAVGALATYFLLTLSFQFSMAQLLFVLTIVLAGVLFQASAAIITSGVVSILYLSIAISQAGDHLAAADTSWLASKLDSADAVGSMAIFIIVGLVTWLANTEIDRSLARARASEASLEIERDSLEIKVGKRTKELEEAHLIRLMELQRFAELGKLSASLLHDVANPLTVASLNIGQLDGKYKSSSIRQIAQSLHHIERYVEAARKQLLVGGDITTFKVKKELDQVVNILSHRAKQNLVKLEVRVPRQLKLTGDAIKFNQLTVNLVLNSIEAYDEIEGKHAVQVIAEANQDGISLTVRDHGKGLAPEERKLIFQSFYSTKAKPNRNMGMGLSLVKQFVEEDFKGRINVKSTIKDGTMFKVYLLNTKD